MYGNGDGSFGSAQILATASSYIKNLQVIDVDGDGFDDVIYNADNTDLETQIQVVPAGLQVLLSEKNSFRLESQPLSLTALGLDSVDLVNNITGAITSITDAITNVSNKLAKMGSAMNRLESALNFNTKLSDELVIGIGNLVDADLAKESAKLQALQVKERLSLQALSIANNSAQGILSLFRSDR